MGDEDKGHCMCLGILWALCYNWKKKTQIDSYNHIIMFVLSIAEQM